MKVNLLSGLSMNSVVTTFRSFTPLQKSVYAVAAVSFAFLAAYLVSKLFNYCSSLPQTASPLNAGKEQTTPNPVEKESDETDAKDEMADAKTGNSDGIKKDSHTVLPEKPNAEQLRSIHEVVSDPNSVVGQSRNEKEVTPPLGEKDVFGPSETIDDKIERQAQGLLSPSISENPILHSTVETPPSSGAEECSECNQQKDMPDASSAALSVATTYLNVIGVQEKFSEIKQRVFTEDLASVKGPHYSLNGVSLHQYKFERLTEDSLEKASASDLLDMLTQRETQPAGGNMAAFVKEEKIVLLHTLLEKVSLNSDEETEKKAAQYIMDGLIKPLEFNLWLKREVGMTSNLPLLHLLHAFISEHPRLENDWTLQKQIAALECNIFSADDCMMTPKSNPTAENLEIERLCREQKTEMQNCLKTEQELNERIKSETEDFKVIHNISSCRSLSPELKKEFDVLESEWNKIDESISTTKTNVFKTMFIQPFQLSSSVS